MGKVLNMTYSSSLTNLCEVNSSFDTATLRICYTGTNPHKTHISKEAIEESLPTIYNCPIVCHYERETDTLGDHDAEIIRDDNGDLRVVPITQPIGVIPESANVWFEEYTEDDGTVNEYLYADVLLWKRQEAYQKIKREGVTNHSMEIDIKRCEKKDGILYIEQFEFNAFCLIGVAPCFKSSALMFSSSDFKEQMSRMMQELKENYSLVNTSDNGVDDKQLQNPMKGGKDLDKKQELVSKYSIDVSKLDFSIDDFTAEELEAKFQALQKGDHKDFSLSQEVKNALKKTVEGYETSEDAYGKYPKYYYIDYDAELFEVYVEDSTDWNIYGFSYVMDGDNVVVDFASKKRKKWIIVDFDEGTLADPFAAIRERMESSLKALSDEKASAEEQYNLATEKVMSMEDELFSLREYKASAEKNATDAAREELFAQFSDLSGNEAFEALKKDCQETDLETLEDKCYSIRGRACSTMKFSLGKAPKLKVDKDNHVDEPYGGLFEEFATEGFNQ